MAISVFPAASTSSVTAQAISTTTANLQKTVVQTFNAGVYQISVSPASSTAIVQFISGSTWIGQTTTSSGTINYNLASAADKIYVQSNNVGDVVTVNLVASVPVSASVSGTLDTITSSGTYTQTGLLWVLAIGGGGGGGKQNYSASGAGGESGALAMYFGNVTGSTTVTIGAAGTGGSPNNGGGAGGLTSFGTYAVAKGGNGGALPDGPAGGTATGTNSGTVVVPSSGGVLTNEFRAVKNGTTGAGAGGKAGAGYGSGIGTGGSGANEGGQTAGSGTGYGAGGGGGSSNNGQSPGTGGAGSPGVIYVLRGF
jgi:hypothetical protein